MALFNTFDISMLMSFVQVSSTGVGRRFKDRRKKPHDYSLDKKGERRHTERRTTKN